MHLRLNPALDPAAYAAAYRANRIVQIPDLFEPATADALERMIAALPWRLATQDEGGRLRLFTQQELAEMSPPRREALLAAMHRRAAENVGFAYYAYPMIEAAVSGWDPGHPIHALTQFLNSPPVLAFARTVIGFPGLTKIDAQATNYAPGHYLTIHVDDGEKKERRAAYTIGLSRRWQPDWGGLLLFMDANLDIARGFLPRFNVLTVFDGLMMHSVTGVAPFAPSPRLSVTGWFRDDPPPRR